MGSSPRIRSNSSDPVDNRRSQRSVPPERIDSRHGTLDISHRCACRSHHRRQIDARGDRIHGVHDPAHLPLVVDSRRLGVTDVESLAHGFSAALLELTREALAADELEADEDDEFVLVDLSADSG